MKAVTPLPLPVFEVAEGFEINLFAEDPQLAKPIQMNFDAQGRPRPSTLLGERPLP